MDIVVLSHLRWDFVYQRPQHLMSLAARESRVLFVEDSVRGLGFRLQRRTALPSVTVIVPRVPFWLPASMNERLVAAALRREVARWRRDGEPLVAWHYSVMAEPLSRKLNANMTVFDCMDELSAFRDAPAQLVEHERGLIARADLVFTGGWALWEAKRSLHPRVHAFPSGVDVAHFARARDAQPEPALLRAIRRPRLVYSGVIDERLDLELVARLAAADIGEVVLIGPVTKISPRAVPSGPRLHRLGMQPYADLPALFAHCDVGLMPFARNRATRFISPTKTPEYLAAGLPVVSTPIVDVVRSYGDVPGVYIAEDAEAFIDACRAALAHPRGANAEVDRRLRGMSWQATWDAMSALVAEQLHSRASTDRRAG